MTDLSATDTAPEAEPEYEVHNYVLRRFGLGIGEALFNTGEDGGDPRPEPVVLFDVLLESQDGTEHAARIVLAGATSAIVAEEMDEAAHGLLGVILAQAGTAEDDTASTDDTPAGEEGVTA